MRYLWLVLMSTLLLVRITSAFEVGGLRNNMSPEQARKTLEALSYQKLEIKENTISAFGEDGRLINVTYDVNSGHQNNIHAAFLPA